jgi:hypothetical protein
MSYAEIEHGTSWMRIWRNPGDGYGKPYQFFIGIRWINRFEVELVGLKTEADNRFTHADAAAARVAMKRHGIKRYFFTRIKNGVERPVRGKIK